mgnify:CR=1 FL=1
MHRDAWPTAVDLQRQGRWDEAETIYQRMLERDARNTLVLHHLGMLHYQTGRPDSAEALMRRAVANDPGYAQAHNNLGVMLQAAGRLDEAVSCFHQACHSAPSLAVTWLHLGTALAELGRLEDSRDCLQRAINLTPDDATGWSHLGVVLTRLGLGDLAEEVLRKALVLAPHDPIALKALGDVLLLRGSTAEARALYDAAVTAAPDDAEALCKLGTVLRLDGVLDDAEAVFRGAVAGHPADASSHFGLALTLLTAGRWAEGWAEFEWRRHLPQATPALPGLPHWHGEDLAGRTLLLTDEQGLGDTLQFARFATAVKRAAGRVVLRCYDDLKPVLNGLVDQVVGRGDPLPAADVQASLMSLPALCNTGPDASPTPYLRADADTLEHWRHRLSAVAGLKVGLVWAGNPNHPFDRQRSLPAQALSLLPRGTGQSADGVQVGVRSGVLAALGGQALDLSAELVSFADTAAVLSQLDLVIAVDTAVAHLAGALARPLWVLLPQAADWRWMRGRDDSPWYPSARLYRQPAAGDWDAAVLRLGCDLARRLVPAKRKSASVWRRQLESAFAANRLRDAEAAIWGALGDGGTPAEALRMLGAIRLQDDDPAAAIPLLTASLTLQPDGDAFSNLGIALRRLNRLEEALEAYRRSCELVPGSVNARYGLANVLGDLEQFDEAVLHYRQAIKLSPAFGPAYYNLANALRDLGRLDEAEAAFRQAIIRDPGRAAEIRNSLAMCQLLGGRYAEGWNGYEARWETGRLPVRDLPQPPWDGAALTGRTILLHAEQGFGDTVQFVRYAPVVAARGARVVLEVQPGLTELCRSIPGVAQVVGQGEPLPAIDTHLPLLSLPRVMGAEIPQTVPYVTPAAALVTLWRNRLAKLRGTRVGLVWSGNPRHKNDRRRSLPLSAFAGLPADSGYAYISLQLGPAEAELAASPMRGAIHDISTAIRDFHDTAAVLSQLDLVITCDTAVAHLAGAMGRPVWVLLPHAPDWRWGLETEDTPWYPTMRLFRQPSPGDWATPLRRVADELGRFKPPAVDAEFQAALTEHLAGRTDEAGRRYRALLARRANHPESMQNLGLIALAEGRLDEAETQLRRAVTAAPGLASAWSNLGVVLMRAGRPDDAIAAYRTALSHAPDDINARFNLGNALRERARLSEAAECFQAVTALRPDHVTAWNNLGLTLQDLERYEAAEQALRRAMTIDPDLADAAANLVLLLHAMKRHDEALAVAQTAADRWPDHPLVRRSLAQALKSADLIDEAEATCRHALQLEPASADGLNLLGSCLVANNRLDEARTVLSQALVLAPNFSEAHWMRGFVELLSGNLLGGWDHFEWRWKLKILASQQARMSRPAWDGQPLDGRTLLVWAEQGLGDTFNFARYLPMAAARGGRVIIEAQGAVLPLLARLPGVAGTVAQGEPLPPHDLHIPLLSLPRLFGTSLDTIPAEMPYLTPEPQRVARWRVRLAGLVGRRVGLVWAGNRDHGNDRHRSLNLDQLAPVLAVPGIALVSLQMGEPAAQLADWPVLDLGCEISDYEDTAAILSQLDLLISVDTSVAHCAGALGLPVWTLLPFAPDWRWLLDRDDTPWYPTMRLYRQPGRGQWQPVIQRLAADHAG